MRNSTPIYGFTITAKRSVQLRTKTLTMDDPETIPIPISTSLLTIVPSLNAGDITLKKTIWNSRLVNKFLWVLVGDGNGSNNYIVQSELINFTQTIVAAVRDNQLSRRWRHIPFRCLIDSHCLLSAKGNFHFLGLNLRVMIHYWACAGAGHRLFTSTG